MIEIGDATILQGDCLEMLKTLPAESVQTCVTSPPYFGLRDYGADGQIGLEPTPKDFVEKLVAVFREVRRVLADDGTLWLNLGDSYSNGGRTTRDADPKHAGRTDMAFRPADGAKPKDLLGIPWRVAFALQADGWFLRSEIIWYKPNDMPESVTDRPTKSHERLFLLTKAERYHYDNEAIKERAEKGFAGSSFASGKTALHQLGHASTAERVDDGMRNKRSVWEVPTVPYPGAHFAVYPPKFIEPCILAGSKIGDTVLDPFNGSGTTGIVALKHRRKYIGCELNPEYVAMTVPRLTAEQAQMQLCL